MNCAKSALRLTRFSHKMLTSGPRDCIVKHGGPLPDSVRAKQPILEGISVLLPIILHPGKDFES